MEKSITLVELEPEDWQRYKELRLEALKDAPCAFGASYQETVEKPDSFWAGSLSEAKEGERSWLWFAETEGKLVGMAGAYREKGENVRHRARIKAVYVTPKMRGKGIGKALFERVMRTLSEHPEIISAELHVTAGNDAAKKLYDDAEFKEIGYREKDMKIEGRFYDTYIMSKFIR